MGTLLIDESGKRRGFRVSQGRFTVGSGAGAGLRLASDDVAAEHAEFDVEDGELFVTPRPGVVPPAIRGVPVKARTRVAPGEELCIGRAVMVWQMESEEGVPASTTEPSPAPSTRKRAPERRIPAGPRREASPRREVSRRLPGWLVPTGAVLVFCVAGLVIYRGFQGTGEDAARKNSLFHLKRAETLVVEKNHFVALEHLAQVDAAWFTPEELRLHESVLAAIDADRAERLRAEENAKGDTWFEFKLAEYEKLYLTGEPSAAVVRVFLERCAEFRASWPKHPELDWVARQERRFAGYPRLDEAQGLEDVLWRAKVLTNARPRDYKDAFELLERFRETASEDERAAVDALAAELESARGSYHATQLQQARGEYSNGNTERAVEWLVQSILGLGDVDMANEAAGILVKFPKADAILRGYASERRATFDELLENEVIAEFSRRSGIE